MITAYGALKANQMLGLMFALGMTMFPEKMMEGYKADTFTGSAKVMFQYFMGIFGTQELLLSVLSAAAARDQVTSILARASRRRFRNKCS